MLINKVIIVGGGPIGLYLASKLEERKEPYILFEATSSLGGQITNFYPIKEIVDIDGFPSINSSDYIKFLINKINLNNVRFNSMVTSIIDEEEYATIQVNHTKEYRALNIVLTTGLGFPTPRTLELEGEKKATNIFYSIKDFSIFKNKTVLVFGGGDSALDLTKEIYRYTHHLSLIHRRDEFRGNKKTIENLKDLKIYLSYVPCSIKIKNSVCKKIIIKNIKNDELLELECDYVVVNYGSIPSKNQLTLPHDKLGYIVDSKYRISKHIYGAGDAINYPDKKRRIEPGNKEVLEILKQIK